jgi:hypothetical protein
LRAPNTIFIMNPTRTGRFGRALIAGGDGQLSRALAAHAPDGVECLSQSRAELDIASAESIEAFCKPTRLTSSSTARRTIWSTKRRAKV